MDRRTLLKGVGIAPVGLALAPPLNGLAAQTAGQAPAPNTGTSVLVDGVRTGTVRINGADIAYSMAGEQNAHPMIVLHGGRGQGQHGGVFDAHKPLSDKYRVIAFDMRGHGQSSVTPPFTFDQIVEDIEAIRQTLGGGRKMILQGGSFGGFIAQAYAVRYPQNLSHLILRGTAPSYRHEIEAIGNFEARAASKAPASTREMLDKVFTPTIIDDEEFRIIMFALAPMYIPDNTKPDFNAMMEKSRVGIYRARVHNDLYRPEVWHKFDVVDQLHVVKAPTLVICGETDWICDPAQSRIMASKIAKSKLVIVPNADHAIPANVLLRETRAFLDGAKA